MIIEGFRRDIDVAGPDHCSVAYFSKHEERRFLEAVKRRFCQKMPHIENAFFTVLESEIEAMVGSGLDGDYIQQLFFHSYHPIVSEAGLW